LCVFCPFPALLLHGMACYAMYVMSSRQLTGATHSGKEGKGFGEFDSLLHVVLLVVLLEGLIPYRYLEFGIDRRSVNS